MNVLRLLKKQINKKKGRPARAKPAGSVPPLGGAPTRLCGSGNGARPPAMRRGLHNSRVQGGGGAMVAALPSRFWRAKGGRQLRWSPRCWTTTDIQNIDKRRLGSKSSAFAFTQRCSLQQSPLLPTAPPAPGRLSAIGSDLRNQSVSRRGSGEALSPPPPPPARARSESAAVKGP